MEQAFKNEIERLESSGNAPLAQIRRKQYENIISQPQNWCTFGMSVLSNGYSQPIGNYFYEIPGFPSNILDDSTYDALMSLDKNSFLEDEPIALPAPQDLDEDEIHVNVGRDVLGNTVYISLGNKHSAKHVCIVGTTGSGKSVTMKYIIHQLYRGSARFPHKTDGIIIVDPKNEYASVLPDATITNASNYSYTPGLITYILTSPLSDGAKKNDLITTLISYEYQIYSLFTTSLLGDVPLNANEFDKNLRKICKQKGLKFGSLIKLSKRLFGDIDSPHMYSKNSMTIVKNLISFTSTMIEKNNPPTWVVSFDLNPDSPISDSIYAAIALTISAVASTVWITKKKQHITVVFDEAHRVPSGVLAGLLRTVRAYGMSIVSISQQAKDIREDARKQFQYGIFLDRIEAVWAQKEYNLEPPQYWINNYMDSKRRAMVAELYARNTWFVNTTLDAETVKRLEEWYD